MSVKFYAKSGREIATVSSETHTFPVPGVGDTVTVGRFGETGKVLTVKWNMTGLSYQSTIGEMRINVTVVLDIE